MEWTGWQHMIYNVHLWNYIPYFHEGDSKNTVTAGWHIYMNKNILKPQTVKHTQINNETSFP